MVPIKMKAGDPLHSDVDIQLWVEAIAEVSLALAFCWDSDWVGSVSHFPSCAHFPNSQRSELLKALSDAPQRAAPGDFRKKG